MIASNEIQTDKRQISNGSNKIQGSMRKKQLEAILKDDKWNWIEVYSSNWPSPQPPQQQHTQSDIRLLNAVICYGHYGWTRVTLQCFRYSNHTKKNLTNATFQFVCFLWFFSLSWILLWHNMLWTFPKRHQGLAWSKYIFADSKCTLTQKKSGSSSFFLWLRSRYIIYAWMKNKKCIFSWTNFRLSLHYFQHIGTIGARFRYKLDAI